jgi:hypothetical protein
MRPPRLARILLDLLAPGRSELAGDLDERFQEVRSRAWYWRQVIGVAFHGAVGDVRAHPVVAARSIFIGWLFLAITTRLMFALIDFPEWLFTTGIAPSLFREGINVPAWLRGFPAIAVWKALLFAGSGWIVAGTSPRTPLILLWYAAFIWCGNAVAFAFYVADPHRDYSIAALIVDLLVLFPVAAFCGGLCARAGRERLRIRT